MDNKDSKDALKSKKIIEIVEPNGKSFLQSLWVL